MNLKGGSSGASIMEILEWKETENPIRISCDVLGFSPYGVS